MANIDLGETYEYPASTGPYYGPNDSRRVPGPYPGTEQVTVPGGQAVQQPGGYQSNFPPSYSPSAGMGTSYAPGSTGDPTYRQTGGTSTTTRTPPDMARPELAETPAVDETRIKRLTQTRSAAGQRALRTALREQILSASYQDNPNVAAMIGRKAMAGFGQGIADVFSKAQAQATSEEYRDRQTKIQRDQAVFNAAMQDYMARFGSTTTTTNQYEDIGAPGGAGGRPLSLAEQARQARSEMMGGY